VAANEAVGGWKRASFGFGSHSGLKAVLFGFGVVRRGIQVAGGPVTGYRLAR
jgi:hypothetical protein